MAKRDEYNEERIDRALEDGKTFLTVLENLTDGVFVCEPLHAAVKLAKQILEMVEKVRKNTKDCKELARDIFRLMFVIVEILKGKSEEDVPPRLKNRLQDVARTLLDVRTGLGELKLDQTSTFRYLPKALLRRDTVGEKISYYGVLLISITLPVRNH
ncbi:hypothetical protein PUNSTDRAFT_42884 [Punctularia strigosozonata HHB-11173 SS5]|uniref:uncharacterized protein n=1 Tax=Punctularia strigosozonata (strain HHB-11173) TaxID=741275 RepID=UPI000441796F|nr:uncharacterized protein PUNSTDRAFT_42884 [Punctularia strigosozonata HHB-11173 SS5]EIN11711.1 hypothetical protein PUNSTDRAFT_42884 [Punctularia strigosozonata HHB-11173 SS5]